MNTKISDAVEAISARFRSGNSVPVERASVTREEWQSLVSALHPQPAELNEVSGNSGELGVPKGWKVTPHTDPWRSGDRWEVYGPNGGGGVNESDIQCPSVRGLLDALAATGKQQGGEVHGNVLAALQQDYNNLLAAFDRQVAAAEKIAATALEQDDRIDELEEALAARQPVVAQGVDLSPIATRKLGELAAQGYVTNGVAIFNPATGQRGLVDNLGFVGWMGAQGVDLKDVLHKAVDLARGGSSAIAVVGWITDELLDQRDAGAGAG